MKIHFEEKKASLAVILFDVLIILLLGVLSLSIYLEKEKKNSSNDCEVELIRYQRITSAYEKLLHRIWLDKPSYVEDCLNETDEFIELNDLYNNDWGSFEFWSEEDSIYYLNQLHKEWEEADVLLRYSSELQ